MSKDGRKLYKTYCDYCNIFLGSYRKSRSIDICRSCSAKNRPNEHLTSKSVNAKRAKSKQTSANCDYDDFIIKDNKKIYARFCIACNKKRYGSAATGKQKCRDCMGKAISSKASHNILWTDFIQSNPRKYRQNCLYCRADVGYRELKSFDSPCKTCFKKGVRRDREYRKKIKSSMKSSIYHRLKRRLLNKSNKKTFDMLNFTVDELITNLESQFQPGMTWDNYGEWHIDHKIPDSWFYYSSTEDEGFKKSWSLENLQPKWAKDNISKGNRYSD